MTTRPPRGADDLPRGRAEALLGWFEPRQRDLPWRRTRDPWAVLVSEVMLQQTQVPRVVPKYEAFLERFPTVDLCADAPLADVIGLWAGLGYNRRAVNLHRCAVEVGASMTGAFPESLDGLLELPGIGPYTARAVLAFAYERDVGVVDTNVGRVLARWEGRSLATAEAQARADAAVPAGEGWRWNQAMFDLGSAVCSKRSPSCDSCPVKGWCRWADGGGANPDPAVGSAGVSGSQSRFEGSDRQGRGRLVNMLRRSGEVSSTALGEAAGWPGDPARAFRVAESLVADGLAAWTEAGDLTLP